MAPHNASPKDFFFQIWHLASHIGNLPIPGNLCTGGLLSLSNFWQVAKISLHAANCTLPAPPWSWVVPHIVPETKISPEKAYIFMDFWPWPLTYDPDFPKIGLPQVGQEWGVWRRSNEPHIKSKGVIIYYREGGRRSVCGEGPEFFGVAKGGDQFFFSGSKGGGDKNFLRVTEGETIIFFPRWGT